jgi:hypothetical protein
MVPNYKESKRIHFKATPISGPHHSALKASMNHRLMASTSIFSADWHGFNVKVPKGPSCLQHRWMITRSMFA